MDSNLTLDAIIYRGISDIERFSIRRMTQKLLLSFYVELKIELKSHSLLSPAQVTCFCDAIKIKWDK
jgi:hypothetical protein